MNIELLVKQSKFNKDVNDIIDVIAPIICGKKITKREIDKANKALADTFGMFTSHGYTQQLYRIGKYTDYSTKVTIYTADRYVNDSNGTGVVYLSDDTVTIYMPHNTEVLTVEELNRYKKTDKYTPTRSQIEKAYKKYEAIQAKIKKLENEASSLPFHYYFK